MVAAFAATLSLRVAGGSSATNESHVVPGQLALKSQTGEGPSSVRAGVYVISVGNVSAAQGTYTVDMYVTMRCDKAPCDFGKWEFMNGRARSTELNADEPLYREYRVLAELQSPPDLRRYPFDSLPIRIQFEDSTRDATQFQFVADPKMNGIDKNVNLAGWKLHGWTAKQIAHHYPQWDADYSRFTFEMRLGRSVLSSFLKTIIPALVIVTSGLLAFALGPRNCVQRLGMGGSSLVGAIMFHINLTSQLPPIGYLTLVDRFMLANYVALVGAMFATLVLHSRVNPELAEQPPEIMRFHHVSRAVVVFGWIGALWAVLMFSA